MQHKNKLQFNKNIYRKKSFDKPRLRIIFIHHAGGSALNYFNFSECFPESWEICFLEIPGRGRNMSEKPIQNREELYRFFKITTIEPNHIPLALFGHSMGAHIAFEYAHFLNIQGNSPLIWLGISGKKPPKINSNYHGKIPLHLKSNKVLLARIRSMGGTPAAFFESPELMKFFLPILKSDLNLCYQLETTCPHFPKLEIPISIFAGNQDKKVRPQEMRDWKYFTANIFTVQEYQGGHFYFQGFENDIAQGIIQNLTDLNLISD